MPAEWPTEWRTAPAATIPTLQVICDEFYYDVDPSNPVEPPGNGSTFQTAVVQGNQTIGSAASTRVQLPRTGGYLTSLILVLRDSAGLRTADTAFVSPNYSTRFFASMKCGRTAGAYAASNLASHVLVDDAAEFLTFSPGAPGLSSRFPSISDDAVPELLGVVVGRCLLLPW